MTDPLSAAAGIAGLIGIALQLTKICYVYYTDVKHAPDEIQDVIDEVRLLRRALSDLEDTCDRRAGPLPSIDHFMKVLSECDEKIASFGLKIDKDFRNPQRLVKRLEWPFRGPEVKLFLVQLQRYRAVFESAKTNAILEVVLDVQNDLASEAARQEAFRKGKCHFLKYSASD